MPTLNWIGKEAVINHHDEVPIHTLTHDRDRSFSTENEPLGTGARWQQNYPLRWHPTYRSHLEAAGHHLPPNALQSRVESEIVNSIDKFV